MNLRKILGVAAIIGVGVFIYTKYKKAKESAPKVGATKMTTQKKMSDNPSFSLKRPKFKN